MEEVGDGEIQWGEGERVRVGEDVWLFIPNFKWRRLVMGGSMIFIPHSKWRRLMMVDPMEGFMISGRGWWWLDPVVGGCWYPDLGSQSEIVKKFIRHFHSIHQALWGYAICPVRVVGWRSSTCKNHGWVPLITLLPLYPWYKQNCHDKCVI